jgi:hypothetical protein
MTKRPPDPELRPHVETIPCPWVATAYNNGALVPAPDGTIHQDEIAGTLSGFGLAEGLRTKLAHFVIRADESPDTVNLFRMRDSRIDHTGSTGIRDPEVDPSKLPQLLSFGEGGRMYREHFARAANYYRQGEPGVKGGIAQCVEFTALLEVFGRLDESCERAGERYLTDADVTDLWLRGRYPEGWEPRPRDSITGSLFLVSALRTLLRAAAHVVRDLFGRAERPEPSGGD